MLNITPPDEQTLSAQLPVVSAQGDAEIDSNASLHGSIGQVEEIVEIDRVPTTKSHIAKSLPDIGKFAVASGQNGLDITTGMGMTHARTMPNFEQPFIRASLRRVSSRFSTVGTTDENQQRGNWGNSIEFLLTCLGYAVGLGNVWRFPYLCYMNGGGAFLVPYLIMLFACGIPMMLMELSLGQYSSQGPLTIWHLCPLMKGIGISMIVLSCIVGVYYNLITAWAVHYFASSLRLTLPWSSCDDAWATDHCVSWLDVASTNTSSAVSDPSEHHEFAADEYFHISVLKISKGIDDTTIISWQLVLCLLAAWVLVFIVLAKGVKSIGKAVYLTSTFPYLVLTVLLINALREPGAGTGILYFLTPTWSKMAHLSVWRAAASQIFFSTGVCFGGTITLASYNRFNNNVMRDTFIVCLGNSATSIFAGLVVFSVLGAMAHTQGTSVAEVEEIVEIDRVPTTKSHIAKSLPDIGKFAVASGQNGLDITTGMGMTHARTMPNFEQPFIRASLRRVSSRFSTVGTTDENQQRGNWGNSIEFLLTCLGYAVGLGNVWRFPYLCYMNGGGAFLVPYLIMLFACGIPMMLMELSLGQYSSQGPLTIWHLCPLMKGIGISMIVLSCIVGVYYNLITAWAVHYFASSLRLTLPWSSCDDAWATDHCVSWLDVASTNTSSAVSDPSEHHEFAADEYFHISVLKISKGIDDTTIISWQLVLCLLAAWVLVFIVLAKGVKSIGKAVYLTSTFPYLVLTVLLINALREPGAGTGILYFLTPTWSKMAHLSVWRAAASQIFFSTGVCFGGTITLASYNRFNNNVMRDTFIVCLGNSATSIFAGLVVFSVLGAMAHTQGTSVAEVVTSGAGLTFITGPQAVLMFPLSFIWSILFFSMLTMLALSTMFPTTENVASSIIDQWPKQLRQYKFWITMVVCTVLCACGIPMCGGSGIYWLQVLDQYAVGYPLLILGFLEIFVVSWMYGAGQLTDNIQVMLGRPISFFWSVMWRFVTPTILLFTIAATFIMQEGALTYGSYEFPEWTIGLGRYLSTLVVSPVLIYAIYTLFSHAIEDYLYGKRSFIWTVFRKLIIPDRKWRPALLKHRTLTTLPDQGSDALEQATGMMVDGGVDMTDNGVITCAAMNSDGVKWIT